MSMNILRHRWPFTARLSVASVWYIISTTSHERTVKFCYWRHCTSMVWHVNQLLPVPLISRYKNQILVKLKFYFNQFIHNNPMWKFFFLIIIITIAQWANIMISFKLRTTTTVACEQLPTAYKNEILISHIFKWFRWFRDGQKDSEDDPIWRQQSPAQNLKIVVTFDELDATDCQINLN